jgi:hypothetical protein
LPSKVDIQALSIDRVMGDKQEWDQAAKARVMSGEAKKHGGQIPEDSYAKDAQSKADKQEAQQKK